MTTHEQLLEHPQPVDKTAALHIAGGDRTGRDELLWAQREAFERAMIDARLRIAEREQVSRRDFARAGGRLAKIPEGSYAKKDYRKHVNKLRSRVGINQKLDERIQKTVAERLAPKSTAPRNEQTLFWKRLQNPTHKSKAMRRKNLRRYGLTPVQDGPFKCIAATVLP